MSRTDDRDGGMLDIISEHYQNSLRRHGLQSKGVGWTSAEDHRLRFDMLAQVIEDDGRPFTVNDLGCGYGAFLAYLRDTRGLPVGHFRGYDINEDMIAAARQREPEGEFFVGDRLDRSADYAFACGIFNVRLNLLEESWSRHVEQTLDNLAAHARRGFAFNMLSTYVDYRDDDLYYGDPLHYFDLCKRRYSRKVSLLHDYPLWEWTIIVRL